MRVEVRLTEILEERGRTIYWLSKQLGVDFTALYRLRDGVAKGIRFELLGRICEALNCEIGDLLVLAPGKQSSEKHPKRNE
ncbi:MAG TPA: helix-turn-helix domain-containing protein [Blastocatellia bacterium]|nr:helix-turn-helix domain-containing protein [Blastocatellia bacterium]